MDNKDVEIMHWMGGSKETAGKALCHGTRDRTEDGPDGYGCKGNPAPGSGKPGKKPTNTGATNAVTAATVEKGQVSDISAKAPVVYSLGHECGEQAIPFGDLKSPEQCDVLAAQTEECGAHFMFSKTHPEWQCR